MDIWVLGEKFLFDCRANMQMRSKGYIQARFCLGFYPNNSKLCIWTQRKLQTGGGGAETNRIHSKPHPSQTWRSYCWSRVSLWFKNIIQFNSLPSTKGLNKSIKMWFIAWNLQEMQDLCVSVLKWGWQFEKYCF